MKMRIHFKTIAIAAFLGLASGAVGCSKSSDNVLSGSGGGGGGGNGGGGTPVSCTQKGGTLSGGVCRISTLLYVLYNDNWLAGSYIPVLFADSPASVGGAYHLGQVRDGDKITYTSEIEWGDVEFLDPCDENPSDDVNVIVSNGANAYTLQKGVPQSINGAGQIYFGADGNQHGTEGNCIEARGDFRITLTTCEDTNGNHIACP